MATVRVNTVIILVYTVAFVDLLSASMICSLMSTYLRNEVNLSATLSGLISSVYGLVQFFSGPIIGAECDIRGYRKIMSLSLFMCLPAYCLLCVKWWPIIFLSRFLSGAFKHTQMLAKSVIGAYLPHSETLKAYGRINAMGNVGFIVGPFLSGHVAEWVGYEGVFVLSAVLFAVNSVLIYALFPDDSRGEAVKHQNDDDVVKNGHAAAQNGHLKNGHIKNGNIKNGHIQNGHVKNGIVHNKHGKNGYVRNGHVPHGSVPHPAPAALDSKVASSLWTDIKQVDWSKHWDMFVTMFMYSFATMTYRSNMAWRMTDRFHIDRKEIGYVSSAQGVASFVTSFFAKSFTKFFPTLLKCYSFFSGLKIFCLAGILLAPDLRTFMGFMCLMSVCTSLMRALSSELQSERCNRSEIGLLTGITASLISIARAVTIGMGGALHDVSSDLPIIISIVTAAGGFLLQTVFTEKLQKQHKLKTS